MKSRISFFDTTILRKDITRFAPVWILYTIAGLMVAFSEIDFFSSPSGYAAKTFANAIGPMAIVNCGYALVTALCLFGDLFNSRMCNALHALPLRRERSFLTHLTAGLLYSLVPNAVLTLLFMAQMRGYCFVALLWLLAMTLEYLFFFSIAALCAICTGSRFAMGAVYGAINALSMILYWFVIAFYEPLLPGLHIGTSVFSWSCPVVWLVSDREFVLFKAVESNTSYRDTQYLYQGLGSDWWYLAVLGGLALVVLVIAILLYRKRKLESAGDFLAFRPMEPFCLVIFTFSVAAIFQIIGDAMGLGYTGLFIGLAVGCFGTEMLLRRTVKVFDRKALIKCVSIGVVFGLSLILTLIDPFGVTRWTPEPEKVTSIVLSNDYDYDPSYHYSYRSKLTVTDPEQIEELVQIHGILVEDLTYGQDYYYYRSHAIHLTYTMDDGRKVTRRYWYRTDSDIGKRLAIFFAQAEFLLGYEDLDAFLDSIQYVHVSSDDGASVDLTSDQGVSLMKSVIEDCDAGNMRTDQGAGYWITVETLDPSGWYYEYKHIDIPYSCENTLKWLELHVGW